LRGDYALSIARAQFVLDHSPSFVFDYDAGVTQRTMLLVEAYGYYYTGDLTNCAATVLLLDSTYAGGTSAQALLTKMDALNLVQ